MSRKKSTKKLGTSKATSPEVSKPVSSSAAKQSEKEPAVSKPTELAVNSVIAATVDNVSKQAQPKPGRGIAWLALLCSVLALAAGGYAAYQTTLNQQVTGAQVGSFDDRLKLLTTDQQSLKSLLSEADKDADNMGDRLDSDVKRIDESLRTLESGLDDLKQVTSASMDEVKANLGQSVARWKLDELHSLLSGVNQLYTLSGDAARAEKGLGIAQAMLGRMDNPRLAAVKSALAKDRLQLKSHEMLDVPALNNRLRGLSDLIPQLALAEDSRGQAGVNAEDTSPEKASDDGLMAMGKSLLGGIGSMVKHKNLDAPLRPSLDSSARFVVYESLQLNIQSRNGGIATPRYSDISVSSGAGRSRVESKL